MEGTPLTKLVATIKEFFKDDPQSLRAIQLIGLNIKKTGMPINESALLARLSDSDLSALVERCPMVKTYFELQRLKYKRELLKVINDNATINKDIKLAQYLLEKNFSDEFDSSVKREKEKNKVAKTDDPMEALMAHLQSEAPQSPVDTEANLPPVKNEDKDAVMELSHLVHA